MCSIVLAPSLLVPLSLSRLCTSSVLWVRSSIRRFPIRSISSSTDATWDERIAVGGLIFCVAGLGLAPLWAQNIINDAVGPMISHIMGM
jgi:NADH-quinone oxidoreductase subunit M